MSETLNFPGQVKVSRMELVSSAGKKVDITFLVQEVDIFEDLYSNTMSGTAIIADVNDIQRKLPVVGEEYLYIEFKTPTLDVTIKKVFYVYRMDNVVADRKRQRTFCLNFVSSEMTRSINTKVAQHFKGKIHEIVKEIYDNFISTGEKSLTTESTPDVFEFIAPYWTPFETINWLAKRSISEDEAANYVFYEDNQKFNYVSISKLMEAGPIAKYTYADTNPETILGTGSSNYEKLFFANKLYYNEFFDYMKDTKQGMNASLLARFDMIFKRIEINAYDYVKNFKDVKHVESNPWYTDKLVRSSASSMDFIPQNDFRFSKKNEQKYDKWFLQHQSLLAQSNKFKVTIEVPGNTMLSVGKCIDLSVNAFDVFGLQNSDTIKDKQLSGKYLITSIRHKLNDDEHRMFLELSKDSLPMDILSATEN